MKQCLNCEKELTKKSKWSWENFLKSKYCSRQCSGKHRIQWLKGTKGIMKPNKTSFKKGHPKPKNAYIFPKGKKHPMWKGGETKSVWGYIFIRKPEHPFSYSGYIKRSRFVVEQYLGRYLKSKETVHHIDRIKTNDNPKNLMAFSSHSAHMRFHKDLYNIKSSEIIFDGKKIH